MFKKDNALINVVPPTVSAVVIGIGSSMIGMTLDPEKTMLYAGAGVIGGYIWGTLAWEMSNAKGKVKTYASDVQAAVNARQQTAMIQIEHRQVDGNYLSVDWEDLNVPDGITLDQMLRASEIVVKNDYALKNGLFHPMSSGKPFSRGQYDAFVDMLIDHKLAYYVGPVQKKSVRVSSPLGMNFFRKLNEVKQKGRSPSPSEIYVLKLLK